MKLKYIALLVALSFNAHAAENFPDALLASDLTIQAVKLNASEAFRTNLPQIKVKAAWDKGITGKGATVAVVDSGVLAIHTEVKGRVLAGYDATTGRAIAAGASVDDNGHGTHVSGIIAGQAGLGASAGVAPDAWIVPIKVFNAAGSSSWSTIADGFKFAQSSGASIINFSGGGSTSLGSFATTQLRANVLANQLMVMAAGNDGGANPIWPARYAKDPLANGQIIAVGSVGANNVISSFSNRAGDTANWYLVAPGEAIASSYSKAWNGYTWVNDVAGSAANSYAGMSGTSMATPHVAGAAALLKGNWPQLSAKQIAEVLFTSATDLGAKGTDTIYGRGLLNVEKAVQPIGVLAVPTAKGAAPLAGVSIRITSVTSALKSAAGSGALKSFAVDDFNRDYQVDLGEAVQSAPKLSVSDVFAAMDSRINYSERIKGNAKFALAFEVPKYDQQQNFTTTEMPKLVGFSFRTKVGASEYAMGSGNFANQFFGMADTPFSGMSLAGTDVVASPFMGFAKAQAFAGYGETLGNQWDLKVGLLGGSATSNIAGSGNTLALMEAAKQFSAGKLSIAAGYLNEQAGVLGASGQGALALGASGTVFSNISGAYQLSPKTWLAGNVSLGSTNAATANGSMIDNASGLTSIGWGASLLQTDVMAKGDKFSVSVSQPLSAVSGSMSLTKATSVNEDGSYNFATERVNLSNGAKITDLEVSYATKVGRGTLAATAMARLNAGESDALMAARYSLAF